MVYHQPFAVILPQRAGFLSNAVLQKSNSFVRLVKENEKKTRGKNNANLSIPNIISSVAAKSASLNINSIWDITLFQLYDQFNRLQNNDAYSINSMRVAAWGDEKKTFDYALWYKNMFDKVQE